jgi:hypothetical protein
MRLVALIGGLVPVLAIAIVSSGSARAADAPVPAPTDEPDTDSRVLLDEVTLTFGVDRKTGKPYADRESHQQIRILRADGVSEAGRTVAYRKGASEVTRIEGSTTLPDGRVERLDPKDVGDFLTITDWELFGDDRTKRFTLPLAVKGAVLDFRTTTRHFELDLAFGTLLGNGAPTDLVRLRVVLPAGAVVEHMVVRGNDPVDLPPVESTRPDGGRELLWEVRDVPGDSAEPFAPGLWFREARVILALQSMVVDGKTVPGRPDLAAHVAWLDARYREQSQPDADLVATVGKALAEAGQPTDAREKARVLYEWVQDHIRYVAVELGEGGWVPHSARSVLTTLYGDCKDKANLLSAMLRVAGIDSVPVVILTRSGPVRRVTMPGRGSFNHAILGVRIGDELVLADPTTTTVPFGKLPAGDQDADILVVDPGRPRMEHTPRDAPESSRKEERTDLTVQPDGALTGRFAIRFVGDRAYSERAAFRVRTPKSRKDFVRQNLDLSVDGLEIVSFESLGGGARDETFELTGHLRGRAPVAWSGTTALVRARALVGTSEQAPSFAPRKSEFLRGWGSSETIRTTVRFPVPVRSVAKAWGGARDGVTGAYRWSAGIVDGALVVERSAVYRPASVVAAEFEDKVAAVFRAISTSDAPLRIELDGEVRP